MIAILCILIVLLAALSATMYYKLRRMRSSNQGTLLYSIEEEDSEERISLSLEFSEDVEKLIEMDEIILKVVKK